MLPTLTSISRDRDMINEFLGRNHNPSISEKYAYDMLNLSTDSYPLLSTRAKRGKLASLTNLNGIWVNNRLMHVDGTNLYYNFVKVGNVEDSAKKFANMGAYVVIMPDKLVFNTQTLELTSIENSYTSTGTVTYSLCKADGELYEGYTISDEEPSEPQNMDLWLDTSGDTPVLKQYSSTSAMWVNITTTYVRMASTGIGEGFNAYDTVTISNSDVEDFNADMILYDVDTDYIVFTGILDKVVTQVIPVTVERKCPELDYICEKDNRIYGCSSTNHEIYVSKLGDPTNWYNYMGISSDSYTATIGSEGNFTGCIAYGSYVYFFKDARVHVLSGTYPSNYTLSDIPLRGVARGSEKSLVVLNEVLYYMSREGICAFDGSYPQSISTSFGSAKYKNASAGAVGNKYYITCYDEDEAMHTFIYDTSKGTWVEEESQDATMYAYMDGDLYYINSEGLYCVYASNGDIEEETTEGYYISGDIGLSSPDNKYISNIKIRCDLEQGAEITLYTQYDDETEWKRVSSTSASSATITSHTFSVYPKRCERMRFKLEFSGDIKIYSITKYTEAGSEV